jgi:DNA polymerase-4
VVAEASLPKSIGKEVTFDQDLDDFDQIEQWLFLLALKLGRRLRRKQLYAKRVTLKLRSPDFSTWTRTTGLDRATSEDWELFAAGLLLLRREREKVRPLRLLGMSAGDLGSSPELNLFGEEERAKRERLMKALDRAREQFGFDAIYPARLQGLMQKIREEEEG